jgi:hypothetical protein
VFSSTITFVDTGGGGVSSAGRSLGGKRAKHKEARQFAIVSGKAKESVYGAKAASMAAQRTLYEDQVFTREFGYFQVNVAGESKRTSEVITAPKYIEQVLLTVAFSASGPSYDAGSHDVWACSSWELFRAIYACCLVPPPRYTCSTTLVLSIKYGHEHINGIY